MVRTEWCVPVIGAGVLAACGTAGRSSADPSPNPATGIVPPTVSSSPAAAGDWTMPTGVFRAERPEGLLELRITPGQVRLYDVTDGLPDLGYAADCVPGDPSRVTCTERDGFVAVFTWSGTGDALELTLPDAAPNHRAAWEGTPWTRVP
jgi:hypothetical protein